eukprot:contig_33523_g8097
MLAATRVARMAAKAPPKVRGQVERSISPYEQTLFGDLMDVPLLLTKARRKVEDKLPLRHAWRFAVCGDRYLGQLVPREARPGAALLSSRPMWGRSFFSLFSHPSGRRWELRG